MNAQNPIADVSDRPPTPVLVAWQEFAIAPLVPVALATSCGLVVDRYYGVTLGAGLLVAAGALVGWMIVRPVRPQLAVGLIWLMFASLAAVYHHTHRNSFPLDDIGETASAEPHLVRLRGTLTEDPITRYAPRTDPLEPVHRGDRDAVILRVSAVASRDGVWATASGLVRLSAVRDAGAVGEPPLSGLQAGDGVELFGTMFRPGPPQNPGEGDYSSYLLDQRIRAEVRISDADAITRFDTGNTTPIGLLAAIRRQATRSLLDYLPKQQSGTAMALLLGDGSAMERTEWEAYIRTGVVHALAISGQHLAVLAGFLWVVMRAFGVRRVHGAWVVLIIIVGYTVLTGLRPSGVRAAVMVTIACGGLILRRPTMAANTFALGWLIIVVLNPTDPFTLGCQFSFLSVFVLIWGAGRWLVPNLLTPMEQLIDDSRPLWFKLARCGIRAVGMAYLITLLITAVNAPLLLADQHVFSPVGILIGPPIVVLTSIALVSGFLLMLLAPISVLGSVAAVPTQWSLWGCEHIVQAADGLPGGAIYVASTPTWWLIGFYLAFVGVVLCDPTFRRRAVIALSLWVLLGLALPTESKPSDELRITFLAVEKGGCAVIETPDGRCLIYDVGTTSGPATVKRVIAPYLWHRSINRIDELFLSHADSDHFNGIAELLRRFPIGQITMTPSFAEKPTREVEGAIRAIEQFHIPCRLAYIGQQFTTNDVQIDVLHPPQHGPPGTENERSLVLLIHHAGHKIVLTGDLEKRGTNTLLDTPPQQADVLMAPHHGSRAALPNRLMDWSNPQLVLVSRGPMLGNSIQARDLGSGVVLWDTHSHGAITIKSNRTGLVAESFSTGERLVIKRGGR